jgi:hypothetical protein
MQMKNKFWPLALLITLSLILSACTINIETKINADGSGEMSTAFIFTKEDKETLASFGTATDNLCSEMQSQDSGMPTDMEFKQEEHGDETWCVASQKFATLDKLREASGGEGITFNTLKIENGKFVYDVTVDMGGGDTGSMPFPVTINWKLTTPGNVTNHNADKKDGNTLTWNLPIGSAKTLHAESNVGSSPLGSIDLGGNWWIIVVVLCCLCLVVIVIAVAAFFLLRKKPASA